MTIEWVELTVTSDHENASDYKVELIAPSGTVSILIEPVGKIGGAWMSSGFRFGAAGFIDEQSQGEWKVKISDIDYEPNSLSGTIQNLKLTIYGH
jgi:subtilisin-like proprotein convertase family protein